ncbi:hypothetical protein E2C01_085470 [Portunus trituberculatus]|uniref:Uncharacterized protein n=1 Tax=Portunus trituberculatus TaxID=210409 RepID=A0A5B7IY53_PORTR|nr:hypothetical protein [Portunus trituberculatus]
MLADRQGTNRALGKPTHESDRYRLPPAAPTRPTHQPLNLLITPILYLNLLFLLSDAQGQSSSLSLPRRVAFDLHLLLSLPTDAHQSLPPLSHHTPPSHAPPHARTHATTSFTGPAQHPAHTPSGKRSVSVVVNVTHTSERNHGVNRATTVRWCPRSTESLSFK